MSLNRNWVVARCWQQCIPEGIVYLHGGPGRSSNTNTCDDQAITRAATFSPTMSLELARCHLPPSRYPILRKPDAGIKRPRPLRLLPLTPYHGQCRLDFFRPQAS
ncbi:hypothetical protein TNCV_3975931 [Trichonephila clavipes]|nr:hypothetical protein TNCV_3975931 [Trichonephila clavipes]